MKTSISILAFIFCAITLYGQKPNSTNSGIVLNLNDTSYIRIYNGLIIQNKDVIKALTVPKFVTDQTKIKEWGFKTTLALMLINIKSLPIEYKIDSVLYSRPEFISAFKFPSTIQLPVSVNGKLLNHDEREKILSKLELNEIKTIKYLESETAMKKYGITPFGVIDLIVE